MKSVLITGGCGFIGVNLIKELGLSGYRVRVLDNLSVGKRADLEKVVSVEEVTHINTLTPPKSDNVQLIVGDITDLDCVQKVCNDIEAIVHLAANTGVGPSVEYPLFDCSQNVAGTLNCLESARQQGVGKFVFASSGAPAGEVEPPIHEEVVPHPVSPYGASKLSGEAYCSAYFHTFDIQTIALRFGNVYGPRSGHKSSIVAKFINQALNGETLEIYGDGNQTRDFIYIDDLVRAVMLSIENDAVGGEVFQIATSAETTVNEITQELCNLFKEYGCTVPKITYSEPRKGDVKRNYSDTSKAKNLLNWQAKTSLKEGLKLTLQSFLG